MGVGLCVARYGYCCSCYMFCLQIIQEEVQKMRKQLEVWHLLLGIIFTFGSSAVFAVSYAFAKGKDTERIDQVQRQHGERITKLETNAELDRRETREQYNVITKSLFDIHLALKDKKDREK